LFRSGKPHSERGKLFGTMDPVSDTARQTAERLADTVGLDLLGEELGADVESSLTAALAEDVLFQQGHDPLSLFRIALADSIVAVQRPPRNRLFRDFLIKGSYEKQGPIPLDLRDQRLSDEQTHAAITLIFSHMVNCFKGAVTELLAVAPCLAVLKRLRDRGTLPRDARLYVGDSVLSRHLRTESFAKGADMHILMLEHPHTPRASVTVAGLAEVKSYHMSDAQLQAQLDKHIQRAKRGLQLKGMTDCLDQPVIGIGPEQTVACITVLPARWRLPRTIRFEQSDSGRRLIVDAPSPPIPRDRIVEADGNHWRITLRWSEQVLAAVAHEMTFRYMEMMGELIYAEGVPQEWSEMSPAQAGRNAAKQMLYYAILRCRPGSREDQRAIALYNSYGFGYALGTSFKDADGRRQMLWPQNLDEIAAGGQTKNGCRIV